MDIYELKESFGEYVLDNKCIKSVTFDFTNGMPNLYGRITYNQAKVMLNGQEKYLAIKNHIELITAKNMDEFLDKIDNVHINDDVLKDLRTYRDLMKDPEMTFDSAKHNLALSKQMQNAPEYYSLMLKKLVDESGLTEQQILAKL